MEKIKSISVSTLPPKEGELIIDPETLTFKILLNGVEQTLGLREVSSNIIASKNTPIKVGTNTYNVPNLTPEQVTAAYNSLVAGRPATITDADELYHLSVMQADILEDNPAISFIFLNAFLLTYVIEGDSVRIEHTDF